MAMTDILDIAQKLSSAGFATLLVIILIGSYRGIWVWGYQLKKAEEDGQTWKTMALAGVGIAETIVKKVA